MHARPLSIGFPTTLVIAKVAALDPNRTPHPVENGAAY
jgi:hypothetical protein